MFKSTEYDMIMEQDEAWYVYAPGTAILINDLPIWDS